MTKKFNTLSMLLAGTFLSFPGIAAAEEITVDYLNKLTGPNVTWSGSSGTYSTELDGKTFYYDYVDTGRTTYSEQQSNTLSGDVDADFVESAYRKTSNSATGGAISNRRQTIDSITGNFIRNSLESITSYGGAIYNNKVIGNITGNFIGNYAKSETDATGGAISNFGSINNIINSNFIGNYIEGNSSSDGGAIFSINDLNIIADNGTSLFSGNTVNGTSNAIYMEGDKASAIALNLSAVNGGILTFDDGIDGADYNINVSGDGSGEVAFNNLVENVTTLTLNDNAVLQLGTGGSVQTVNMSGGGTLKLDVDFTDGGISTGVINVAEKVSGDYSILANPVNDGDESYIGASSVFLTAPNDEATFGLARVIGSPYEWDVVKNTTDSGYSWALSLTDYSKGDSENPSLELLPEVYAGIGLQSAAIEQTRSLTRNVADKVAAGREYCPNCGIYSTEWDGKKLRNAWILAQGESANIDKPVKIDAKIWGVEAGFDIQNDLNNTLGVFVSYRNGDYDLASSDIDIDSYLAGLYYRYDKNMNWLFATVYGGAQKAEAQTDDKIAKFDTDGVQFGASVEAGHTFALSNDLTLDPSLGISYTQINFDDAHDNVGKEYNWKDVKHFEAELGAKLEKQIDYAKVYVKPSIIQTWTSGDSVKVTGLNKLSTYDDGTLGRIELGGRYGFTDAFSVYGWVNYTFGSDYDATAFGAGLNYSW